MNQAELLIQRLIEKYADEPGGPQRILDHPLFRALPLETQVELINKYATVFGRVNTTRNQSAAVNAAKGLAGGAAIMAMGTKDLLKGSILQNLVNNKKMIIAGAGAGALIGILHGVKAYKKNLGTSGLVNAGDALGAVMSRQGLPSDTVSLNEKQLPMHAELLTYVGEHGPKSFIDNFNRASA